MKNAGLWLVARVEIDLDNIVYSLLQTIAAKAQYGYLEW